MPFINIKVLKGTLSQEKKQEMIKRVSETVAEIEEVNFENWGIGGNAVTPEILKAILEG